MGSIGRVANCSDSKNGCPNALFDLTDEDRRKKAQDRVPVLRATQHIPKGFQIVVTYGDEYKFKDGEDSYIPLRPCDTHYKPADLFLRHKMHYIEVPVSPEQRAIFGFAADTKIFIRECYYNIMYLKTTPLKHHYMPICL